MARRNQKAFTGRGNGNSCREISVIALVFHHGDQDGTEGSSISCSRTGNSTEEIRSYDIHHGHSAGHPSNQRIGQVYQLIRYTSASHEASHGNKERNCHQGERPDAFDHQFTDGLKALSHNGHTDDRCDRNSIRDRESQNNQNQKATQKGENRKISIHCSFSPFDTCSSRLSSLWMSCSLPMSFRILLKRDSASKITMAMPAIGIGRYMYFLLSQRRLG